MIPGNIMFFAKILIFFCQPFPTTISLYNFSHIMQYISTESTSNIIIEYLLIDVSKKVNFFNYKNKFIFLIN